jgi:serine/threonine-protein kinase RsbW
VSTNAQPAEVRLTIPADGAYVAVPRAVVGNLAARNDFTVDAIDDLRIAVDEACALLLPHATAGTVDCVFTIDRPTIVVEVAAGVPEGWHPDTTGFGWTVLAALVESAVARNAGDRLTITLTASALSTENA